MPVLYVVNEQLKKQHFILPHISLGHLQAFAVAAD